MLKNWRYALLILLFFGPYLAFMGLGFLYLKEHGWVWVTVAGAISIVCGVAFTLLIASFTKSPRTFLPPIDWDAPQTFSEFDRQAWALVEAEAEHAESLDMEALTRLDTYIDSGKRLASRLAAHYNPLSADPIERVAVVELITALELAAEDLAGLCRQVPGGDLVTPADWKRAVVAAGYIQKASDLYTYLLPLFNPVTGIPRLASQHLMVKPAWKSMQQNVLRWFHRAFVNRLGMHLVELYSGRLVIGANQYRKLTRKSILPGSTTEPGTADLVIAVAGARDSGKSKVIEAIEAARGGDTAAIEGRIVSLGGDKIGLERLMTATFVEVDGYTTWPAGRESARGRATRRHSVEDAADSDLLILVVDARLDTLEADEAFLRDWAKWYADHPGLETPPAMAVATHLDDPTGLPKLKAALSPIVVQVVAATPGIDPPDRVFETFIPPLTTYCHRAERNALIRNLRAASARSRAGRLVRQIGRQGRHLWKGFRERGKANADAPAG